VLKSEKLGEFIQKKEPDGNSLIHAYALEEIQNYLKVPFQELSKDEVLLNKNVHRYLEKVKGDTFVRWYPHLIRQAREEEARRKRIQSVPSSRLHKITKFIAKVSKRQICRS